jgi:hypothetical protein
LPALNAPPLDADVWMLVDWLELTAFHSDHRRARLDGIDGAFRILDQEQASDTGAEDAAREERRALIEQEVNARQEQLDGAYPFQLSEDGEQLDLVASRGPTSFYLTCLVFSHVTNSPILLMPPSPRLVARGRRREFQILSTLAVAGHLNGPALSFGWPRANGATIVQAVRRACQLSGVGLERDPPGPVASKFAKDGGMDVIGWRPGINGLPPPAELCFGQAASGQKWREKDAPGVLEDFYESFYLDRPQVQATGVTIVPYRLTDADYQMHNRRHGHILDRFRTPLAAIRGLELHANGMQVDEADRAGALAVWLGRYRSQVRRAA